MEKGTEALRNAGIVDALRRFGEVVDFGDIKVNLPAPDLSDPKLLNPNQVEVLSRALADKVKTILDAGCLLFIVGGDDSVLMGVIEGLRRSLGPNFGMVYMDAHGDFNTPETTPSGIIGGMDVAIVAGRGPKKLAAMFGHSPLLSEENIVLYGVRDLDPLEAKALAESEVKVYSREIIKSQGAEKTAEEILSYLGTKCGCLYLHIDLDVLDKSVFSAQDFSVPDGLSKKEFQRTLKVWVKSGKLCGVAIMVFDAGRDPDGSQARRIVELIAGSFAEALK